MIKLSVENKTEELKKIAVFIEKISRENSFSAGILFDLNVVLEELFTNIILHAYNDSLVHTIDIYADAEPGSISIRIIDDGTEFNPINYNHADHTLPLQDKPVGGVGLLIVRQKVDQIEYKREANKNILSLVRKINNNGV